ncbi:hypothetical protein CSKR_111499 [Clonorchis sinensis]|uniref:Reverse transcriptase domain-containing protein n=1 Tax=Clonorchis sinensis TaxID=79923 RepID=A0A419PYT8_CLOSI|nr:hypothetical protein CSKR_111499 [Clonorchis sinensis]
MIERQLTDLRLKLTDKKGYVDDLLIIVTDKALAVKKSANSEMHSFANKFGFSRDSPGKQLNLSFGMFLSN